MVRSRNEHLEFFRAKAALLIVQWADRMRLFIAESRLMGDEVEAIRKMRKEDDSTWALEREALNRALKAEAAGLVNRMSQASYAGEL